MKLNINILKRDFRKAKESDQLVEQGYRDWVGEPWDKLNKKLK